MLRVDYMVPLLPFSLPLTRRLQFHLQLEYGWVGSTSLSTPSFSALYLDRSRHPETEMFCLHLALL